MLLAATHDYPDELLVLPDDTVELLDGKIPDGEMTEFPIYIKENAPALSFVLNIYLRHQELFPDNFVEIINKYDKSKHYINC